MKSIRKKIKWNPEYSIAALLGVLYIILLGLFTWYFNIPS
jgi:hypothetical protein